MRSFSFAALVFLAPTTFAADACLDERAGVNRGDVEPCLLGYWAQLKAMGDCRFTFAAGLSPAAPKGMSPRPLKFRISGGRCERWPNRPLSASGASVQCARSGNGATTVILETTEGVLKRVLAPLPARRIPDEPVLEQRPSSPQNEILTLYRSRDYRQVEFGRVCPNCRLLAADIRPTQPDATILEVAVVDSGGSPHWLRCPAAFRCGVPEFTPPNEPRASGCSGQRACRVWRLSDDESEGRDTVQITYQVSRATCKNCPEGVDYASARKRWETAKLQAERTCETLPNDPAQLFGGRTAR
jgi:hypothetical protein